MIYLLIGYMWLFVHRPFEVWPVLASLRIERVYMLVCMAYWCAQPKAWVSMRSHVPIFLLAGTLLVQSFLSPYATFATVEDWFKILVLYVLLVSSIRTEHHLKLVVGSFLGIMVLYELHSLREYFNGRGMYRMGTWRMIGVDESMSDPNSFGASINYSLPFFLPFWQLPRTRLQTLILASSMALAAGCIVLTGSRSALVAMALCVLVVAIKSKYRVRVGVLLLLTVPLIWARLPDDLRDRYLTLVDSSVGPAGAAASAEGRSKSFWYGMRTFAENPFFGAGLESYRAATGTATHNLYNQAMGELGIWGLGVLVGLAWSFWSNAREAKLLQQVRQSPSTAFHTEVCFAALGASGLLFFLGYGAHNLLRYNWLWFGAFSGLSLHQMRLNVGADNSVTAGISDATADQEAVVTDWRRRINGRRPCT